MLWNPRNFGWMPATPVSVIELCIFVLCVEFQMHLKSVVCGGENTVGMYMDMYIQVQCTNVVYNMPPVRVTIRGLF